MAAGELCPRAAGGAVKSLEQQLALMRQQSSAVVLAGQGDKKARKPEAPDAASLAELNTMAS